MHPRIAERITGVRVRRAILGGLLLLVALGVPFWVGRSADFAGYVTVGRLVLEGRHIYLDAPPGINTWPPFFAVVAVPLAVLASPSPYVARAVWVGLNLFLLVVVLRLLARLVYGAGLTLRASGPGLSLAAPEILVPLALSYRYVLGNFEHLQINLVLFALALGGMALQSRGRAVGGGVLVGVASAIKVMPVVLIAYLAYRRRWRAAGAAALATAAFSLSPILVFGWRRYWDYLAAWRSAVGTGWGVGRMNQSVFALWDRLLGHRLWPLTATGDDHLAESGAAVVRLAVALTLAVVVALALRSFRGSPAAAGWPALAEWSVVFLVGALFGPVAWKSYLVVLLLPNTLLFAVWRAPEVDARTRTGAGAVLFAAFALGGLTTPGLLGRDLAERLEMASVVTVAGLVVLGGLLWLRARLPRPDAVAAPLAPAGSAPR